MRTPLLILALVGSFVAFALAGGNDPAPESADAGRKDAERTQEPVPDRYIVTFRRSVESASRATEARERRLDFQARFVYRQALKGFSAKLSPGQRKRLETDPDVVSVVPDRKVRAVGQLASGEPTPPPGVRRIGAATTSTVRGMSGADVAVIDSGIDLDHPDLNASTGPNCVNPGTSPDDDNGHGTHVAGSIAGENDGAGVTGVAPGTRVHAAKVLDAAGSGTASQVICGIDWVTSTRTDSDPSNDVEVANMSLGGTGPPVGTCATTSDPEHRAICSATAAGVHFVVAAGNSGWDFDYAPEPDTPAAYPEVLTVTAMGDSDGQPGGSGGAPVCRTGEADDRYASFSNYAATAAGSRHAIAGPGVCIRSTVPGGGYGTMSGTSMATPHLAGALALCLEEGGEKGPCSGLSPAEAIDKMRSVASDRAAAESGYGFTGDPEHPVTGKYFGHLTWAGSSAPDSTPPTISSVSPADSESGVETATVVSVAFDEPMDKPATESAFSLSRTDDGAPVPGSFSWNANTMTFRPSAALAEGAQYSATVSTAARDAAGNALGAERAWGFKTLTSVAASPSAIVLQTGSLRGGGLAQLASDDNGYYSVNSTTSGTRASSWYGRFTGVSNDLRSLKLTYKGKASAACTQTVALWRWSTSSWVSLDSRSVGTTEVLVDRSPSGALADYVSGTSGEGEVRARVRCTRSSSGFYTSGDLMRMDYTRP